MELRTVDPRTLKLNPDNPRRISAGAGPDAQLTANIKEIGLIQPPTAREVDGTLTIRAGNRRVSCSIAAGLATIEVLVLGESETETHDSMRAFAENTMRAGLGTVDIWRAVEALTGDGWTEEGIATAMALPPRTIRRLKLCGNIHSAILDQMARGDEPTERDLRIIASAPREDQAQAWKKFKPKKGESTAWYNLSNALTKRRLYAKDAAFGADLAQAHGIVWEEDLFAEGDQDNRYTTQVDAYLGAQHEQMTTTMPKNAIVVANFDEYGRPKLPPKAERVYGKPGKGDFIAYWVDDRTGQIETFPYRMPPDKAAVVKGKGKASGSGAGTGDAIVRAKPGRPPVTQEGAKMIGDFRTDALHEALRAVEIDDLTLIGLLVLAFAGKNVDVKSGVAERQVYGQERKIIAGTIIPDNVMTQDPETVRKAGREMIRYALSLRETTYGGNSGPVALVAGQTIGADEFLPGMATQEFLSCLSKPEMERIGSANGILPRQTGKATRAAFIERFKDERFVYPDALFIAPDNVLAVRDYRAAGDEQSQSAGEAGEGKAADDGDRNNSAASDAEHVVEPDGEASDCSEAEHQTAELEPAEG